MTSTTSSRLPSFTATIAATATAALLLFAASVGSGIASAQPTPSGHSAASSATAPTKQQLLHPAQKYYGISVAGAPYTLGDIATITKQTGKQPNLLMFYEAWDSYGASGVSNTDTADIKKACNMGLLPVLTWESWNTKVTSSANPGVAWAQPAFAPAKIVAGTYDKYIKATAQAIKSLGANCPVVMRFDQEQNGYWYPWGVDTVGMPGTQAQRATSYIQMWRHVWRVFNSVGATNALWLWSPNYQGLNHPKLPGLKATYPGRKYVDWVGIDAYYNTPTKTFDTLFGPTMTQLKLVAPKKPWLVAETGVGSSQEKPSQITNLLDNVASNPRLNGFVYFDQHKATDRAYWPFQQTPASLAAFKAIVDTTAFAAGKPGSL